MRTAVLAPWIAETLFAIGAPPVALPELERGARVWGPSDLPAGTVDLGLAGEPNIELLEQLRLDLILADSRLQGWILPRLEPIAPVVAAAIYTPALRPLAAARAETARFGDLLAPAGRGGARRCGGGCHLQAGTGGAFRLRGAAVLRRAAHRRPQPGALLPRQPVP